MGKTKILDETVTQFNPETGEVTYKSSKQVKASKLQETDEFIKVTKYLNVIFAYNGIPLTLVPICLILAQRMEFKTNDISLFKDDKLEIGEMLGLNLRNTEKYLNKCKKYDILRQRARGKYTVNPFLFNCGSLTETRNLQAHFDIDSDTYIAIADIESRITGETVRKSVANKSKKEVPGQINIDKYANSKGIDTQEV